LPFFFTILPRRFSFLLFFDDAFVRGVIFDVLLYAIFFLPAYFLLMFID